MAITYSSVSLEKGLRAIFAERVQGVSTLVPLIATTIDSTSNIESYGWMGQSPKMSEFKTERIIEGLASTKYSVTNKEYEATIAVKRSDLEDDQLGALPLRIRQLASSAAMLPNQLLMEALINGTSSTLGLCYDGTAFFGDSHPARNKEGSTQDNLLAGTGTSVSALKTDIGAAIAQMTGFKAENGTPFHDVIGQLYVVAPAALEMNMREVLGARDISGTTNTMAGRAELIVSPWLTDANDWYLLHTGPIVRPLIYQVRTAPEFEALETGESAFMRGVYYYGARARGAAAYGFWQDAIKTVN